MGFNLFNPNSYVPAINQGDQTLTGDVNSVISGASSSLASTVTTVKNGVTQVNQQVASATKSAIGALNLGLGQTVQEGISGATQVVQPALSLVNGLFADLGGGSPAAGASNSPDPTTFIVIGVVVVVGLAAGAFLLFR